MEVFSNVITEYVNSWTRYMEALRDRESHIFMVKKYPILILSVNFLGKLLTVSLDNILIHLLVTFRAF